MDLVRVTVSSSALSLIRLAKQYSTSIRARGSSRDQTPDLRYASSTTPGPSSLACTPVPRGTEQHSSTSPEPRGAIGSSI